MGASVGAGDGDGQFAVFGQFVGRAGVVGAVAAGDDATVEDADLDGEAVGVFRGGEQYRFVAVVEGVAAGGEGGLQAEPVSVERGQLGLQDRAKVGGAPGGEAVRERGHAVAGGLARQVYPLKWRGICPT